jgi:hypothetical protein
MSDRRLLGGQCFEFMVHVDEELAHDGSQDGLGMFAFSNQSLVERLKDRIAPGRRQG